MKTARISINRAPVLTLWATIVAERLGYDHNSALTLGKAVAGLNAQAKGQRLGIFEKPKQKPFKVERKTAKPKQDMVALLGRLIPTVKTSDGVRAKIKEEVIMPESVAKYLTQKFGDDFVDVQDAMKELAKAYRPVALANGAYMLYEKFRPNVPAGERGWGSKGELDLNLLRSLAK